jgi:DNA-binding PadR family transcriptional regulator
MTIDRAEIDALLPLPPATFHILMALADQERHGYAIIQDVAERTDGELRMSAGTLYRSIQRMLEQGLIAEVTKRPAVAKDDSRRRYYRVTPFGTAVARAEMRRLTQLVRLARARGLTPEPTSCASTARCCDSTRRPSAPSTRTSSATSSAPVLAT